MNYCDISDIENYTLKEIATDFEPNVEQWIGAVSRMMDTMSNRTLVAPAVGSGEDFPINYYDGNDTSSVLIDDCQEIVSVTVGDEFGDNPTEIAITDYVLRPRKTPYRTILLKNDIFPIGSQNIAVEGRFGLFNEIPDDIRMACTVITAGIINNQTKGGQMKRSESIGNYSVTYSDEQQFDDFKNAVEIINSYKKYDF